MNDVKKLFWGIAIILLAIFAFKTMCYTVQPGERGVAVTLGKMDNRPIGEGFGLKLPWTTIHKVSIRNVMCSDETECFTSDTQVVKVKYVVLEAIPEAKVCAIFRDYQGDVFKTLIAPRMQEVLKQLTSQHRADQIVKMRDQIKVQSIENLRKAVGDLLFISDVNITNIDFTKALENAIEQKTVKEQEALAAKYTVEKAQLDGEATVIKAAAEAKALQIQSEALKQSQSMIFLEGIRKWDGKAPQTLFIGSDMRMMPLTQPIK